MPISQEVLPSNYSRRLLDGGKEIESVCIYCGFRIVGSVSKSLIEDECNHRIVCSKPVSRGQGA